MYSYLKHKIVSLMLPYVIFFAIGVFATFIIPQYRNALTFSSIKWALYYGQPECFHVGQIWFLMVLFQAEIIFDIINRFSIAVGKNESNGRHITIIILTFLIAVCSALSFLITKYEIGLRLPFRMDCALMAVVFYGIGFLLKQFLLEKQNLKVPSLLLLLLIFLPIAILFSLFNGIVNIVWLNWGKDMFLYLFNSLIGIAIVFLFSILLQKIKVLRFIGKNSLIIFGLHSLCMYLYCAVINRIFNIDCAVGNCTYGIAILGTVVTLVVMTGIAFCYVKVNGVVKSRLLIKN